jgi:pyruvate ferredoxin oxidoreductase alpha subunit
MLQQLEGSLAVAKAVALCRPEVVSCYPITPQTHIVEAVSAMVKSGELAPCEFLNVESEFAAMSVLIGASAAGARTYTATSSQGLLFMAEALFNASGLGLPIVMTDGNRAIGAPINIWNDHSDTMSMRDCGWIQLHAESNQEAIDLHIQAYRIAEQLSIPVMVCMDGFVLTHAYEKVNLPSQEQVDRFLPPYEPVQVLDTNDPVSIGAMVGPEAYTEVRYLLHHKHLQAIDAIEEVGREFRNAFGRDSGGLLSTYRTQDAEAIVVAMGSVSGTIQEAVDELRKQGVKIGSVKLTSFRPFPLAALRLALEKAERVIVVEKYLAPGLGGILASNIRMALRGLSTPVETIIAGLGGRVILKDSLRRAFVLATQDALEEPHLLDMNWKVIHAELARAAKTRRSGPTAEHVLHQVQQREAVELERPCGTSVPQVHDEPQAENVFSTTSIGGAR